jgi:hypothetical protein
MTVDFTGDEWSTIAFALGVAAAKYREHARMFGPDSRGPHVGLAAQFTAQAHEAARLQARIIAETD